MDNNTQEPARARQIQIVDESTDILKLFTLLTQVKYVLIIIDVERQID